MAKRMLIDALHPEETRVVIADEKQIYDFDFVSASKKQLKGNIYLAKITRVEPSLQAAFVEYGGNKQGFLPFSEIHSDYYQIPVSDRKRLMEEAARESEQESSEEQSAPTATESETTVQAEQPDAETPQQADLLPESTDDTTPAYLAQAIEVPVEEISAEIPQEQPEQNELPLTEESSVPVAQEGEPTTAVATTEEKPAEEALETLPSEEEEMRRPKRNVFTKRYRIQEVIRRGQIVLVQVIKEERGNKGVSLTTYLSLAGRYCVLMPNSPKDGGISRKIASPEDRKRLKAIYTEFKLSEGMSVIIRTAGMGRTRAEIKRDYDYLVKLWNQIRENTLQSTAPALIHEESDIIKRAIRDQYSSDISEIVVEGENGYEAAKEFMKLLMASHTAKIKLHDELTPMFYAYGIEDQLLQMHEPIVKLRSGGYIVINPTEALISIDVNSGRATGERNIEETATKTNLEAAAEVARQLRLRDLAGLIVIDFIDMMESRNRRNVERALKDSLKADRAKIQLGRISPFGLLEMSRQRLRPSISETNMVQCPHCQGRGHVRSNDSMSVQIIRALEKEASSGTWSGFRLIVPQAIALHLLNTKRDALRTIENRHQITVQVLIDTELTMSEFNLEKMRRGGSQAANDQPRKPPRERQQPQIVPDELPTEMESTPGESNITEVRDTEQQPREGGRGDGRSRRGGRGRRGGRRGGGDRPNRNFNNDNAPVNAGSPPELVVSDQGTPETSAAPQQETGAQSRPPRERGKRGRGRRPWRGEGERGERNDRGPRHSNTAANSNTDSLDSRSLPAFAAEPIPEPQRAVAAAAAAPAVVPESTPRDPNAPPKKGWWQKMIDLDD